jgi:hypothetical protein
MFSGSGSAFLLLPLFSASAPTHKLSLEKLGGLTSLANYTDRAIAARRRTYCQLLWIEGATWSA